MRRFMPTLLVATVALLGTLSLGGCIVPPHRDHGHSAHRDGPDRHHDSHHDDQHDRDHGGDHGH